MKKPDHMAVITMKVKLRLHHLGGTGCVQRNQRSSEITMSDREEAVQHVTSIPIQGKQRG